jgi:hypothetical protein
MEQRREELLMNITDTVGTAFMGLTFGCAKCHDHKFDPILQKDYYRLQAFFANVRATDEYIPLSGPTLLPTSSAPRNGKRRRRTSAPPCTRSSLPSVRPTPKST